jgi:hypothetical protein
MKYGRQRLLYFLALAMLLAIFAGCKGESPTAPPVTGTGGGTGGSGNPGGGITPPVGATLTLTVVNPNPVIDSISTITATVTLNGQPVVNGTAVEFTTNLGIFTDTQDVRTIRTTTGGVASAVLTSPDSGVATVTATVNNVTKTVQVTFHDQPVVVNPPSTAPTISSVTPNTGPPAGGTQITINGTNFRAPVRVIVDAGPAGSKEAFVVPGSVTPTQIVAVVPGINLTSTQTQAAAITVIVDVGGPTEARVTRAAAFTYLTTNLTPIFRAISPGSGPIDGGTRVTIIGDAFDAAGGVQVFFGAAQAQIVSVNFNQIIATSPTARDTADNGSGAVTGFVDLRIKNIASGKEVAVPNGFRYTPKAQITLLGPNEGPFTGGTRFTIDGTGFNEPLSVTLAGVGAQIIKVTGTQITAISNGIAVTSCADVTGPTVVTNGDNGDQAIGPTWIYRVFKPVITNVTSPVSLASNGSPVTTTISVAGAVDPSRVTIGTFGASITNEVTNSATNITTVTVVVPATLKLDTEACGPAGVTRRIPTAFDVVYTSVASTCSDTLVKGLTVNPPTGPVLTLSPPAFAPFTATITPGSPGPPIVPPTVAPSPSQTINIVNTGFDPTGGNPLIISSATATDVTPGGCARFSITLPSTPENLATCDFDLIIAQYTGRTTAGTDQCRVTLVTNAGTRTLTLTGSSQ